MFRFSAIVSVLLSLLLPAAGQFDSSFDSPFGDAAGTSSRASLVPEVSAIAPGEPFTVALRLVHPDGWHSYYRNSGGVELPPEITWTLPDGFTAGPIQWPVPEVKDGYFGQSFIYDGSPVFLVELTPPPGLSPGAGVTITANAAWQICEDSCIDEDAAFTLELPVAASAVADPRHAALFAEARANLPAAATGWEMSARSAGGTITLEISPPNGGTGFAADSTFEFIPNESFVKALGDGGSTDRDGDRLVVSLERNTTDFLDNPIPQGASASGILIEIPADGGPRRAMLVPDTAIARPPAEALSLGRFLPVIGFMMLGGLILNLMPCVFPVIGLKIMGFVQQAGQDRAKIAGHGLIFTSGVLASFAVISGILFVGREAVGAAGWGYQLQNPWLVLGLMVLMFVLALNMFGLFEIGASAASVGGGLQSKHGVAGSFFSGVLATVIATPCSAPFLGAAIGTAITLPAGQFFSAFAAMAMGLALPYLLLSVFPSLLAYLPRPGAWMESFKQAMSFLLFATAGVLLWVYAGQIGLENLLGPIFGLSAIAVGAWIYGRWHLPHRSRRARVTAVALAACFSLGGLLLAKPPSPSAVAWEPWSQERVDALLAKNIPVYIDFTAAWCLTCQVNKKLAYGPEVVRLIEEKGIVMLRADKTNRTPAIDAKLSELGRTAIPVNVLMVPGQEPIITPELLTPGYLADLFASELEPADG
jgi:thiol:disulfide interchange protein DsbD